MKLFPIIPNFLLETLGSRKFVIYSVGRSLQSDSSLVSVSHIEAADSFINPSLRGESCRRLYELSAE
jgi:hypothetical protein